MKNCLYILFCMSALLLANPFKVEANNKYAGFVIHANSGQVLYAENSNALRHPASLTKVMTLYELFTELENGRIQLQDKITISYNATRRPPSRLGLKKGEKISVEDAIYALAVKSANDIATAVAEHISGSESAFARRMTQTAKRLGMKRTRFMNASGLTHRKQLTAARDMARLALAMINDFPYYYRYFSTRSFSFQGRTYRNHNKLLGRFSGTDGVKTGYTRAAGFNLLATSVQKGQRLVAVVLGGKSGRSRNAHVQDILQRSFRKLPHQPTWALSSPTPPRPEPAPDGHEAYEGSISLQASLTDRDNQSFPRPRPVDELGALILESSQSSGDWTIQVGAFYAPRVAKNAAREAIDKTNLSGTVQIAQIQGRSGKVLYRARITGITKKQAKSACKLLIRNGMDCISLAPDLG